MAPDQSLDQCSVLSTDLDSRLHVENPTRILLTIDLPRTEASRSRNDHLVPLRCTKHCRPHDHTCQRVLAHLITYTSLSLPTIMDLTEPEDIIYLQTSIVFKTFAQSDATDIFFDIISTDAESSFEVQKRAHQGMIMGVVQQVKPIIGPMDLVLQVAINYVKSGVISHYNIVFIHIFISDWSL